MNQSEFTKYISIASITILGVMSVFAYWSESWQFFYGALSSVTLLFLYLNFNYKE